MTGADKLLAVAQILQPHGLRGELFGMSLAPEALDFEGLILKRKLQLRSPRPVHASPQFLTATDLAPYKDGWLFTFAEVTDRTAAEGMKGVELCLPRNELPPLPEGWYWEAELEGLPVTDARLGPIGTCAGLEQIGGQWSLKVSHATIPNRVILIPMANALIPVIDAAGGRIETRLPLGYPGFEEEPGE